jgi:uncharacterized integral membrane protein (TIGR00697 family)
MMFNEILFLLHGIVVIGFSLGALALGKEALIAIVCLYGILANLFVTKQITMFGLDVISTDVFIVGSVVGLNLLSEYFGKKWAQKAVVINVSMLFVVLAMGLFQVVYLPNPFDVVHEHFSVILGPMPRILITSAGVFVISQFFNIYLYAFFNRFAKGKYFVTRNIASVALTQFLDTLLFGIFALYGIVHSITEVISFSYLVKMLVVFTSVPFVKFSKKIVNKAKKHNG